MKKHTLHVLLLMMGCSGLFMADAQTPGNNVSGLVAERLSKQGLPNASVVLRNNIDTSVVLTELTGKKGEFHFKNLADGIYALTIDYIGYKTYRIDSLTVNHNNSTPANLSITLELNQKELKAVTVTALKPFIVQGVDKIVLNVAESPVAAGGNAYDVLQRVPGLSSQGDVLQFRGKIVAVLIDDKYTNLSGADLVNYLSSMPANGIEKIEVIPNPSAKYDAQGGSVINIKTAKNKNFGTNGVLTAGIGGGRYARYNSGLSLNYRNKKLNVYGSYDYQHNAQYYNNNSLRQVSSDETITENENDVRKRDNHSVKMGIDYTISKKSSLSVLIKGMDNFRNRSVYDKSSVQYTGNQPDSFSTVATSGYARFFIPSVNVYYKTALDSTGRELRVNADYFKYDKVWNDDFTTRYFDAKGQEYTLPLLLRDYSPANNTITSLSVDYIWPTRLAKIETGAKTTFTVTDNNILWEQRPGADWKTDSSKTNHFIYRENINAAYINASKTIKKFNFQLGVRAEQTNTEGNSVTLGEINRRSYTYLFPNVSVEYNASGDNQFGFSYHENIRRFGFDVVNPFIIYRSQYSYSVGNPDIRPSRSHNFELSHSWKNELTSAVSYSHYVGPLAEIFRKDDATNAVANTSVNLGSADNIDVSSTFTKQFLHNKWTSSNTAGAFYAKYNSSTDASLNQGKVTAYLSSQNMFVLPGGIKGELSAYYYSPMEFGVFKIRSRYSVDAGFSKTILKGKGSVAVNVTDIFNTLTNQYEVASFGVFSTNTNKAESRFVKAVFTYKFGNKNVKGSKTRKTGIEDERSRMSGN